jgi:alkylation response protein AidB-like acyl-CoA dehydrogenase
MDFRFGPEEEAFRKEVGEFLDKELPPGYEPDSLATMESSEADFQFRRKFSKKLVDKGWLTMHWPKEYGGQERSHMVMLAYKEETTYRRAPGYDIMGAGMIGPLLMLHGTDEQKKRHLPGIASGEVMWAQGFSEPNAGSDLASLQTRAEEKEDHYLINGQKVWTSFAHHADWLFFLARTNPDPEVKKHRGISFFLVDMRTPGIEARPLANITGGLSFNEVFFDNVRVPKENLVGEKNGGWAVTNALLSFERAAVEHPTEMKRLVDDLVAYCNQAKDVRGAPLAKDHLVRQKLAKIAIEAEVAKVLCYRVTWLQGKGEIPFIESSVTKIIGTELQQKAGQTAMELLGLHGLVEPGPKWARLKGKIGNLYLNNVGWTIAGGTSEIQRTIIATRGLGLPRG